MPSFITVATFTHPHELLIVKARLEAENIACYVLDEKPAQVFLRSKLRIHSRDAEKALNVLVDMGYYSEEDVQVPSPLQHLDAATALPLLKSVSVEMRLVVLFGLIAAGVSAAYYFFNNVG